MCIFIAVSSDGTETILMQRIGGNTATTTTTNNTPNTPSRTSCSGTNAEPMDSIALL